MTGLSIMNRLMDPAERDKGRDGTQTRRRRSPPPRKRNFPKRPSAAPRVRILPPRPAPYPDRKVRDVPQLRELWEYINPQMLFVRHLGFKSNFEKALAARDPKALELHEPRGGRESRGREVHEGQSRLAILRRRSGREYRSSSLPRSRIDRSIASEPSTLRVQTEAVAPHLPLPPPTQTRRPLPLRLRDAAPALDHGQHSRSTRPLRRQRRPRHPPTRRGIQSQRRIPQIARLASDRHRDRRSLRRMAASPSPGRLGVPRPAEQTMHRPVRKPDIGANATASATRPARAREDRPASWKLLRPEEIGVQLTEGFMIDSGSLGQRVGVPSSRLSVLWRGRCRPMKGTQTRKE